MSTVPWRCHPEADAGDGCDVVDHVVVHDDDDCDCVGDLGDDGGRGDRIDPSGPSPLVVPLALW